MSKVFSISMATVLMLMSLMGPMQPTNVMADEPQEANPLTHETSVDDTSDTEDVLVDEPEDIEQPPAEDEVVTGDDEELAPIEEPAENANAPPADEEPVVEDEPVIEEEPVVDDEPVVEDEPVVNEEPVVEDDIVEDEQPTVEKSQVDDTSGTTEVPDDTVFSPSAVDPEPGDCPIGEICDGGGGEETPVEVNVALVSYVGTYYFPNAAFTITDGTTSKTVSADEYGWAHTKITSGVTYSISVSANGYGTPTPAQITPGGANNTFSFELSQIVPQKYTVSIEVIDAQMKQPLENAEISLVFDRTWSSADSGTSEADGTWTSKELVEGTYWASVSHDYDVYHGQYDIEVNVPTSGTIQIQLQPISKSPISLKFINADSGAPVEGAYFGLYLNDNGTDVEATSPASGEYVTDPLEHGNYGIHVLADGYGTVNDYRWDHPHNGTLVIELQPIGDGTVTIHAVDFETGDPLPDAMITILDADKVEVATGKTGADGKWISPVLPGGYYTGAVYPVYHYASYPDISIVSGNTTVTVQTYEFNDVGYLWVNVIDITYGHAMERTKVTVREVDGGMMATGFTDDDGFWSMPYLPAGYYEVTFQRTGYTSQTINLSKTNIDEIMNIEMHRPGQFKFRFWLRLPKCDCNYDHGKVVRPANRGMSTVNGLLPITFQTTDEFEPIVGATARLVDPVTMDVIAETTSDDNGLVDFGDVYEGSYILQISGDGFADYSQNVELTGDLELNFVVEPENPDEDTTPGTDDPDDGTTPGTENPGDGTNPGTDDPDDGANPGTDDPDDVTTPGTDNPDDGANSGTDVPGGDMSPVPGDDESDQSVDADGDNDVAESDGSIDADPVAQSSGTSSDASSGDVNQLPNTGAGESRSHLGLAALTLVAAFTLLSALGIRRSTR